MLNTKKSKSESNKEQEDEHFYGNRQVIEKCRFFQPEIVDDDEYEADDHRDDFERYCRKQCDKVVGKPQRNSCSDKNVGKDPDPTGDKSGKRGLSARPDYLPSVGLSVNFLRPILH